MGPGPEVVAPERFWLAGRVEEADADVADHVSRQGLRLAFASARALALFEQVADVLSDVPELAALVADRTRRIHLLHAEDGYDISHSEPMWKSRIFVSIPERDDRVGALRLAESVIHEAMHLHLTLFEDSCPLVADRDGGTFSPWRKTQRPFGGVLHGLFVFACLRAFFCRRQELDRAAQVHVRNRLAEIEADLQSIDRDGLIAGLNPAGRKFVQLLWRRPQDDVR